ncbi:outer membrane protein assembly factor BamB family protein [Haloarchaeobius amylolyticus]|uniref:outer membrane protein assembly factor BamB family protein n=1 Tax=Haloarchaeobius amylolyticus TaxID=1198296 RepID=UPI00226D9E52|nr:PQQ-binding-like beta-propeller repeat protein [Haloarchaeobius amylolyticus]
MSSPNRRRFLLGAGSVASVGLAGCTGVRERLGDLRRESPDRRVAPDWRPGPGTWAERGHGPANTKHSPHATPPREEPAIAWRHDLDGSYDGDIVVADGRVFLATDTHLLALDATDGTLRWEHPLDAPCQLKYVDGRLYQLNWDTPESDVVAWASDGTERWRTTLPGQLRDVHEQDGYVFVTARDRYWTLHADTGAVVRARDQWVRYVASAGDAVYATYGGSLVRYDVDGRTLAQRWRARSDAVGTHGRPVVVGERVYVPRQDFSGDGEGVVAYDPAGEKRLGVTFDEGPPHLTWTGDGLLLEPTTTGDWSGLLALAPDGSRRWRTDAVGGATPIAADGTVFTGFPLTALDAQTGDRLWELDLGGPRRFAAAGSTLYVGTREAVFALRA